MNICNKPPNKTAPENLGQAVPEVQVQRARRNGWSWPLHIFQITGWLLCLFFALVGFGILVPLLPRHWLPAGYISLYGLKKHGSMSTVCMWGQILCPGACFIYHLVVHLTAVSIDPADANVRAKNYLGPLATFNRNQHAHVIENHHCHVCDVNVSAKAKHCGTCNKCVCGFDHHCKWLNNCVGERNYWLFLNSVLSAILGLGLLLLIACYVFAEFFIDPMVLRSDHHFYALKNQTDRWFVFLPAAPVETQAPAILITTGIFILLSLMIVVLLGHLLIFHIYLLRNKLTTYEYIVQHRFRQDVEEVENQQESGSYQIRSSQETDIFSGNPGYTDPGIQVGKFSTVTSGIGFSKLYAYGHEADPEQSSLPDLHFAVPSQQQKERGKWTREASSSAVVSISKTHASPWPSFSDPRSEFSTIPAATTSPHGLHLLVSSFPLQAAVPPSSSSLIQAAGPPADYHLESAQFVDEIPVVQTHLGSLALHRPPRNNSSNSQQHPLSTDYPRGDRKKKLSSAHKDLILFRTQTGTTGQLRQKLDGAASGDQPPNVVQMRDSGMCHDVDEFQLFQSIPQTRLCLHECLNLPGSYHCLCPPGYLLHSDCSACEDVNECTRKQHNCTQGNVCINTFGGHRCVHPKCPLPCHNTSYVKTSAFAWNPCPIGSRACRLVPTSISFHYLPLRANHTVPHVLFKVTTTRFGGDSLHFASLVARAGVSLL